MNAMKLRKISTESCQKTGTRHLQAGQPCEDVVVIIREPEFWFCGLADGQSGKRHGAEGGRACLEVLAAWIRDRGVEQVRRYPYPDELPCMMMQQVRACLKNMADDMEEYASTLLGLALDPVSGQSFFFHLGDGGLTAVRSDGSLVMLSAPENGPSARYTWLTTSNNAVSHLSIGFCSLETMKRLIFLTDGATALCRGSCIRAGELLKTGTTEQILERLKASDPADDASCIVLDLE